MSIQTKFIINQAERPDIHDYQLLPLYSKNSKSMPDPLPAFPYLTYFINIISHFLHYYLQTPALLMTPSNSSFSTPFPTPAPPLASKIISLNKSSSTSSFSAFATLFNVASVILSSPPPPLVKSRNASSTSCVCESDVRSRLWNFRAQIARNEGYSAKPSSSGSRIEVNSASSEGLGGIPNALHLLYQHFSRLDLELLVSRKRTGGAGKDI